MKIVLKKFVLLELLEKAASVVPSRDAVPVLKNYLFEVYPNVLHVSATDMALSLLATTDLVEVTLGDDMPMERAVFPAKRLLELVRQSSDGDVTITVGEDSMAVIDAGRAQWLLPLADPDEYPDIELPKESKNVQVPVAGLLAGLQAVRGAAVSQDVTRAHMMLVDVSKGRMRAADGVRFHQIEVGDNFPDMQIPIHAVDDLIRLLKTTEYKHLAIAQTEDAIYFYVGEDVFVTQKMTTKFPNIDEMLLKPAMENKWRLTIDRDQLAQAIKRVRVAADENTSAVYLDLTDDSVLVSAKDKMGNYAREEVDAGWKETKATLILNHAHLLDLLSMNSTKSCEFWLGPGEKSKPSAVRLRDEDAGVTGILTQLRSDFL